MIDRNGGYNGNAVDMNIQDIKASIKRINKRYK